MYQGSTMKNLRTHGLTLALAALLPASALTFPQATAAQAPAAAPVEHPSADASANVGRKALDDYLNAIAARETATRREVISRITTRAEAEQRQREVRAKMLSLFGSLPQRIPLNPRITGSTQLEGFRVDKVLFDSQPNFPITALLYVPTDPPPSATDRFPAIVMAPGHSPAGKAGDVAFASAFARAGFVVLSYDPIGQGERLQYLDPKSPLDKPTSLATRPTGEHGEAGLQPTLIGDALARYFLWDGMRAVDYLQSLPEVDPHRIGAFGCSGGGTMTALLGALDPRVAAVGVACYTTSWDALLPSATGVQDSEQSTPNFIASGLDFPDWSELAAPRPYAIIATTEDMFPFAGAKATEAEARRFYSLFNAQDDLSFITGPGHHGNLRPILPQILAFFAAHLHPDAAYAKNLPPITDPFAQPRPKPGERPVFPPPPPASLTQVTPTGQLGSSYPDIATVFTLNRERAATVSTLHPKALAELRQAIREVTHAGVVASTEIWTPKPTRTRHRSGCACVVVILPPYWSSANVAVHRLPPSQVLSALALGHIDLVWPDHISLPALVSPLHASRQPAILSLLESPEEELRPYDPASTQMGPPPAPSDHVEMIFTPRPSPPGTEETKSPLLGPFYLTELRSELVGKTLLGMRVDDVIRAVDYLAARSDVDPNNITAEAHGHLGLVLLHAAVLDPRLKHVTIDGALGSYRDLVNAPLPLDAPQDILPGVLRHYDIADLIRILGPRVTFTHPATDAAP
jgi:cephalosporin-C deacetylase-like acetyl esterase